MMSLTASDPGPSRSNRAHSGRASRSGNAYLRWVVTMMDAHGWVRCLFNDYRNLVQFSASFDPCHAWSKGVLRLFYLQAVMKVPESANMENPELIARGEGRLGAGIGRRRGLSLGALAVVL